MTTPNKSPEDIVREYFNLFNGQIDPDLVLPMLAPGMRFIERPNMFSPEGSVREVDAMLRGMSAGNALLETQKYTIRDVVTSGELVVTRLTWEGITKIDAGELPRGTKLTAHCVSHILVRDGLIAQQEQHDCFEQPVLP